MLFWGFSISYWLAALYLTVLASVAPCGFAPGIKCELEGPSTFFSILGVLGPLGVMAGAAAIYIALCLARNRLSRRR